METNLLKDLMVELVTTISNDMIGAFKGAFSSISIVLVLIIGAIFVNRFIDYIIYGVFGVSEIPLEDRPLESDDDDWMD